MSGYVAPKLDTVRIGFIGLGNRGPGAPNVQPGQNPRGVVFPEEILNRNVIWKVVLILAIMVIFVVAVLPLRATS